jgi:uncharacterized metal-binding protein
MANSPLKNMLQPEVSNETPGSKGVSLPQTRGFQRTAKTVIAPCMGVGKIVASVTRRASYLLKGQCPDDVELLSLPALLAGDAHERELLQNHPGIIIDGCALRCAAHIFRQFGVAAIAKIEVNQVMKERKIGPGKTRKELESAGKRLSDFTAERVLEALRDEGLSADFVPADALQQAPPEGACACPHAVDTALANGNDAANAHAKEEAAETAGVCASGPRGEPRPGGKHHVKTVTVLPCQGIKRTGGRITQRAAYHVVEDRFLGRTQLLCISALAAGVQEDVDMLEKFPTVAINGCGLRCASVAAEHHGVPAAAHVNLHEVDPAFDGEARCYAPDLTEIEASQAVKLGEAASIAVSALLDREIDWTEGRVNLHGLVHEPGKINALTGYADSGKGLLVRLATASMNAAAMPPAQPAPEKKTATDSVPEKAEEAAVAPELKNFVSNLFKPKGRASVIHRSE